MCDVEKRNCMLHLCDSCPGKEGLSNYLKNVFEENEYDLYDIVGYKQWVHTDMTTLIDISATVEDFISLTCDVYNKLRDHHFIAKAQSSYLSRLKESLSAIQMIILQKITALLYRMLYKVITGTIVKQHCILLCYIMYKMEYLNHTVCV